MLVLWLLDLGLGVMQLLPVVFGFASTLELPESLELDVPVPMIGSSGVAMLNSWWPVAIGTATALAVGRAIQWAYQLIPMKMT